jgi:hypothetical protein
MTVWPVNTATAYFYGLPVFSLRLSQRVRRRKMAWSVAVRRNRIIAMTLKRTAIRTVQVIRV